MSSQSEQINELAKALALAQPHMAVPEETGRGNYGSYSTLSDLRKAVLPALNQQGIAVVQLIGSDGVRDFVETKLVHSSGQWISSQMNLKIDKPSMQGYGSAVTYACRYSLQALAGGGTDDDGEAAETTPSKNGFRPALEVQKPKMKMENPKLSEPLNIQFDTPKKEFPKISSLGQRVNSHTPSTKSQAMMFTALCKSFTWSDEAISTFLQTYGYPAGSRPESIFKDDFEYLFQELKSTKGKPPIDL